MLFRSCNCPVCISADPHDKRLRTSVYITTKEGLNILVDASPDFRQQALKNNIFNIDILLVTHSHYDHIGGLKKLLKTHGRAKLIIGRDAQKVCRNPLRNYSAFFASPISTPKADRLVVQGERIEIDGLSLEVLDLPGHSPGSIGLYEALDKSVYCGDTLFAGSIGRTDFPGASHELLLESIRSKLMNLPDDTKVWPGHGQETTIGVERRTNPFLNGEC